MKKQPRFLVLLVTALALIAAACSGSADEAATSTEQAATAEPTEEPPTASAPTNEPEAAAPEAENEASMPAVDFEDTFASFGNPEADNVIVVAQGGPVPALNDSEAESMFAGLVDLDEFRVVLPHQAQTLDPEAFSATDISFEEAKEADTTSTRLLADVVQHFVDQDRGVAVVGISFGAFVVQDLLVTQGNIADGYLIQVGRLDMPAEVWEPFSEGRFVSFVDGVEIVDAGADEAGMGGETPVVDANMARLAAGLGHKRYTELLADVDLSNVVYANGKNDEQVGRLNADELAFLEAKGVRVLTTDEGHGETIGETLLPGLELLFGGEDGAEPAADDGAEEDNEDIGYLPADQVDAYIAAYQQGLATSSVTIDGEKLAIEYAGSLDGITVNVDGGTIVLAVGADGLEGAQVIWQDRQWDVLEEPDITAFPEPLGGEGNMLSLNFTAVSADDPADSIDVELDLDVSIVGMGASVVEVVDGYATISGTLGTGTYVQLADLIENNPEVDTLVMVNVDGSENDEINVHTARLIRAAGWTTWVPANGDISSGGVDMFVAGVDRIVEPGGFVGVHSWGAGDGELTGRDYPRDSPAHRSQLEYFTEMMGDEAGTEFYFYTLEASPFDRIHRMTPAEITEYGLTTADAPLALPTTVTGPPAGYLQLTDGVYLKLQVLSCSLSDADLNAEFVSNDFGPIELSGTTTETEMSIPAIADVAPVDHEVTGVSLSNDVLSGMVNLDIAALTGDLDTSNATFMVPCAS